MIRFYLCDSFVKNNEITCSIMQESDSLNLTSIAYHYDTNQNNILAIVSGVDADKLSAFMLPNYPPTTLISSMKLYDVNSVTSELLRRKIDTARSVSALGLVDNICKHFNKDFKGLGNIMSGDFD